MYVRVFRRLPPSDPRLSILVKGVLVSAWALSACRLLLGSD
jgi:hypothetical protein